MRRNSASLTQPHHTSDRNTQLKTQLGFHIFRGHVNLHSIRCSRHNVKRFFVRTYFSSTPFFVEKRSANTDRLCFVPYVHPSVSHQPSAIDGKRTGFSFSSKVQLKLERTSRLSEPLLTRCITLSSLFI